MPSHSSFRIERMAIGTVGWEYVTAPFTVSCVHLKNLGPNDVVIRTDSTDSDTEDTIAVGGQEDIVPWRQAAWSKGDRVCALQASGGASTVVVRWVT